MRRPALKTRLLGHPLSVMAAAVASVWSIILWLQGGNGWLALLAIPACSAVAKASDRRLAYLAYRREWNSLAPPASSQPVRRGGKIAMALALAMLLAGGAVFYSGATIGQPGDAAALVGIAGAALVALVVSGVVSVVRLIVRAVTSRRANPDARTLTVEVCVVRPLLRVPPLADAYRALPAYCQRVLS